MFLWFVLYERRLPHQDEERAVPEAWMAAPS
jgi:hypothetical protein